MTGFKEFYDNNFKKCQKSSGHGEKKINKKIGGVNPEYLYMNSELSPE